MASYGMLRRVAFVISDVPEELSASFIRVTSVRRLLVRASLVASSPIVVIRMMETLNSSETSVLTTATRRNIPEETFFVVTAVETSNLT
jgi:hypothetical protein